MTGRTQTFRRRLLGWYDLHRRELPWRTQDPETGRPDPYRVFVSESMLQQTQVATVIPYFHRFIELFPTPKALADADPQTVLRAWQGLGYYSRARNLQAAVGKMVADFAGRVPGTVDELSSLPGVGRYTAGAVASIAFGVRAPILDGNVVRVVCRLDAVTDDPRLPKVRDRLWSRADELVPADRPGDFNSSLMELGATVCTPRKPSCLICPVRSHCEAADRDLQDVIPLPKVRKPNPVHYRQVFIVRRGDDLLIEQRPPTGRWAGLWQFVTVEATSDTDRPLDIGPALATDLGSPHYLGLVEHGLTHRQYRFRVFTAEATSAGQLSPRRWITIGRLDQYPFSKPQLAAVDLLKQWTGKRPGV